MDTDILFYKEQASLPLTTTPRFHQDEILRQAEADQENFSMRYTLMIQTSLFYDLPSP
jgi:hypothetical protein